MLLRSALPVARQNSAHLCLFMRWVLSNASKRAILRCFHLILSIPILGYVYSPFAELPNYAPIVRFVSVPVLILGILDVRRRTLRHHWRCGMAWCPLPVWNWGGYPESGCALHRAEDLVGDSCATSLIGGSSDENDE